MLKIKKADARTERLKKKVIKPRNLNVLIDTEILKRFKTRAAINGETMTEVLTRAIIEYLKN